jgi:hypothetical protein
LVVLALSHIPAQTIEPTYASTDGSIFKHVSDLNGTKISDLGESSPEICILRIDQKTGAATNLLIRTSKAIHVREHWH